MTLRGMIKNIAVASCAGLLSISAQAATVVLVGDTMTYEYDDTQANIGLWGTIGLSGDTVTFLPTTFEAESINGNGGDPVKTDATFLFDRVYANNGGNIDGISVNEFGDYEITNGGEVQVDLYLQAVTANDGGDFTWAVDSNSFDAAGDSGGLQHWGLLTASLDNTDFNGPQTEMSVTIQNTLTAITSEGNNEIAWVEKKLGFTAVAAVPVPAAAWLFGSAMLGLLTVGRRKAAAA